MTHPLTDKICEDLILRFYWSARSSYSDRLKGLVSKEVDTADNMRTAADWQLEQDAEFWKLVLVRHLGFTAEAATTSVKNFKKAMRPK